MPAEYQALEHPFGPLFDGESRVLVLGSFPSVKSREQAFFYGHPQNRFWPLIAKLLGEEVPRREDIEAKKRIILFHHLALSIRNVRANDLSIITNAAPIRKIFCNGAASYKMLQKYGQVPESIPVGQLPSTSPANAAWSLDRLAGEWQQILEYLQ